MGKEDLALYGGKPVRDKPLPPMFPGATFIDDEEADEVLEVLKAQSLFRYYGPKFLGKTERFEKAFADYIGVKRALAVSSGTGALCTALAAVDVGPGDEVIMPGFSWIMDAMAALFLRAIPIIAEIDETLSLDPEDFERRISEKTKAVIAVHMRGFQCDMDRIRKVAAEHGVKVVEDVAQACGGSYKGRKLGSMGDVAAFSFQLNKVITAGEGGAVTTNDEDVYVKAAVFHDAPFYLRFGGEPSPGLNFRLNEVSAAVLLAQLRKIDGIIARMRKRKANIVKAVSELDGIEVHTPVDPKGDVAVAVIVFLESFEKAELFARALNAENIGAWHFFNPSRRDLHVYYHWDVLLNKVSFASKGCPYTCPIYGKPIEYSREMCPKTLKILSRAVNIDVSPLLTDEDEATIIEGVEKVAKTILR
ncbi:DegT/DnrJ/EryC1/StrS family aminotransferase [Candidatus Bathyarchaeota archaeon]|nr:DegT/DnrJ/EryC1/StrS family aminotransferase [Candidatus Bathyarchaeota archaeon]